MPALAPEDAQRLQALIQEHCGLRMETSKLTFSLQRAWPALGRLGITDIPTLIRQLTFLSRSVWPVLMPFLTVNETYFMREPKQLDDFMVQALPGLRRRAAERGELGVKLLSAACSTGEEAYTLTMMLEDADVSARVLGVDIDHEALARAEGATYGAHSFRGLSAAWRAERFEEASPNTWRVKPSYRHHVSFKQGNLLQVDTLLAGERFDAIFCRNVLIYFERATQLAVIQRLRRLLWPGGCLFLGHSEIFVNEDLGLEMITTYRSTMYQLAEGGA
jgi:chemotaxis protein methyltransferase CheR